MGVNKNTSKIKNQVRISFIYLNVHPQISELPKVKAV